MDSGETFGQINFAEDCPFTPKQQQAAVWLSQGFNGVQVAAKIGVTPRTIYVWCNTPLYRQYLNAMKNQLVEESFGLLLSRQFEAARVIGKLLASDNESIRLKAAVSLIRLTTLQHARRDMVERLAAVESRLGIEPPPAIDMGDDEIYPLSEKVG